MCVRERETHTHREREERQRERGERETERESERGTERVRYHEKNWRRKNRGKFVQNALYT